nr:cytochrome P450 [Tanacetum cinerariifolium]
MLACSHYRNFYGYAVNQEYTIDVYSKRRIIAVTELKIVEWNDYKHLDWILVRRDDDKIYKFKEDDLKRLRLQDIEDMLLLLVQGKLSNLTVEERFAFNVSLRMFTRSIDISGIEELMEMPRSQPIRYYLKHEINKELIEGLIGNQRTYVQRNTQEEDNNKGGCGRLILEWEERIKLHREREKEFNQWRSKVFNNGRSTLMNEGCEVSDEGGFTMKIHYNNKESGDIIPEDDGSLVLIGHLHLLAGSQVPHKVVGSMADKLRPIFTIQLGAHRVLVVSNVELAKECLTTNDKVFASRPKSIATKMMSNNYANVALSPHGPYWRKIHKIVVLELVSHRRLQMLIHIRVSEVN